MDQPGHRWRWALHLLLVIIICSKLAMSFRIKMEIYDPKMAEDAKKLCENQGGNFTKVVSYFYTCIYPEGTRDGESETMVENFKNLSGVQSAEQEVPQPRVIKSTSDTYWPQMWQLNGDVTPTMKVQEAWNKGYTGNGIIVAVVDDGLDVNHVDLKNNMESSIYHYDYNGHDNDTSHAVNDTHGTWVAGLLAAEANNSICIVGIAFKAKLIAVRLLGSSTIYDSDEASALSHQLSRVHIYSNSWGPPDGYGYFGMGTMTSAAVQQGINTGRNGKGVIYVWAAGNGGTSDNCNGDGYVNSIYTIATTSLGADGKSALYSEVCTAAMAVTYSGGNSGKYLYSTGKSDTCYSGLQGTSFSTPEASAIIALALQANPNLNWRDVQHLIVLTSKKYSLSDNTYSWQTNGAMKPVHPVLGFGLMDAEAMVTYAVNWTTVPSQTTYQSSVSSPSIVLPTYDTVGTTVSIYIGSDCTIQYLEHVVVRVDLYAGNRRYIEMSLIAPEGTTSYLMTQRNQDLYYGRVVWDFMSVNHWGERPHGTWQLKFRIASSLYNGTLYSWYIKLYGTVNDPLPAVNTCSSNPCGAQNCTDRNYGYFCGVYTTTTSTTTSTTTAKSGCYKSSYISFFTLDMTFIFFILALLR